VKDRLWLLTLIIILIAILGVAIVSFFIMLGLYIITSVILVILGIGTEDKEEGDK